MSDEYTPSPRYHVYPVVGDQIHFDEELHIGNDKVTASLVAKRSAKVHPLGVILVDWHTGASWVWRERPRLTAHPVEVQVHREDAERWFKDWCERYLRQRRQ